MSSFSWLLISDLHLKSEHTTWSQSVVLRDMVRDIEQKREGFANINFVIVSGDLAHGGKPAQYILVENFLDDLIAMLRLGRNDVFIVPGNHDIDRDIGALTFHGTRAEFHNAENVEKYLSNAEERTTLLKRLTGFSEFERRYSEGISRTVTQDGLAYFVHRLVGDIPIGIVGLNSALACGDDQDERMLVVGDRPLVDICEIIKGADVRLVIGVLHHPPSWLREFDQRTFNDRFLRMCDVIHRGHLHEPDFTLLYTSSNTQCLAITAGAGYVWRQFKNSYSIVSFNPSAAQCSATYYEYDSHSGNFASKVSEQRPLRLRGNIPGGAPELCASIQELAGNANRFATYLSALLLQRVTEVPVPLNGRVIFASVEVALSAEEGAYRLALKHFLGVRNSLLAFASTKPLAERVFCCKDDIAKFANRIAEFADSDQAFGQEMMRRLASASEFCEQSMEPDSSFVATLNQFAEEGDWEGLESVARRYSTNNDPLVQRSAKFHLCLALAHSDFPEKHSEALAIADELRSFPSSSVDDFHLCFSVNRKLDNPQLAHDIVREALTRFGDIPPDFLSAARRFAIESGNRELRILLDSKIVGTHEQ